MDSFLAREIKQFSRARLQKLIKEGSVFFGEQTLSDPAFRVQTGDCFCVIFPEPEPASTAPLPLPLSILFEDEHLLVLEKPAGLVVHPAPGHADDTLANALVAHCGDSLSGIGGVRRPGIVHRLDKDVSGVMVVAKNDRAHIGLAAQFSVHSVTRVYEALVWGLPQRSSGTIDQAIGRHPHDRKRMTVVAEGGKAAVTHYRVVAGNGTRSSRVEFRLETGRTHQIRVHSSFNGHPIIGDPIYRPRKLPAISGDAQAMLKDFRRIALHARHLGFDHPATGDYIEFDVPAPAGFDQLFAYLSA